MHGAAAFVDSRKGMTLKCYNLYFIVELLTTRDGPAAINAKATYWSKITIFAYHTCIRRPRYDGPRRNIAITFGMVTIVAWLPDGEKIVNISLFLSTKYMKVTDGRTDRQTDGHRMTA